MLKFSSGASSVDSDNSDSTTAFFRKIIATNEVLRAIFLWLFITFSTRSVFDGNVFSAYLFTLVGRHNAEVGIAGGVTGMTGVLLAPVVGILSDKYGRIILLKSGAFLGYISIIMIFYGVIKDSYRIVLAAQIFYGSYIAVTNPTMDALLADSVESGTRSRVYTLKVMVLQIANSVGPLLSIALFLYFGNEWNMETIKIVVCVGLGLFAIPVTLLLSILDNENANIEMKEKVSDDKFESQTTLSPINDACSAAGEARSASDTEFMESSGSGAVVKERESGDEETSYCKVPCMPCCDNVLLVPAMISMSDVITGLASGMTVKFFPIFFLHVLQMDPIQVQTIYLISPFLIAFSAPILQGLSRKYGRILVTCCVKSLGVILLFAMAVLTIKVSKHQPGAIWVWTIILIYLVRTALMNSTKPLTKSILMDFVPKHQRGRWQSLESVNMATWSGSAVLGGYLIDEYGFAGIFCATAVMQACAMIPLLKINHAVPMEGREQK
eukprot:GSChrysophyteH1.ASY1.ANO1.1269.1 assembled CDS